MSPTTDQRLALFETELSQIGGEDLARDLIQYGPAPSVLEAQMLMADGVEELSEDMKNKILLLIEKHVG